MELTPNADAEARSALRAYLADHGLDPLLADGPVGARYFERRRASEARTPADVFGRWFAETLGGAPGEAEALGWVAWLVAGASSEDLLAELDEAKAAAVARRAPRPAFEAPLAMPVQNLQRFRSRRGANAAAGPLAAGRPA